ncbi:MAG TPA: alpha/beta hydrolase [Marmoricola sp.]|nr:alpha/beta hydrolase [Marmoricola sp.]
MSGLRTTIEAALLRAVLGLPDPVLRALVRRPVELDGQRLDTEMQLLLLLQRIAREPSMGDLTVESGRRRLTEQAGLVSGGQPIGAIRDLEVDGATGPLAARLYVPTARLADDAAPTLLFLHGGGWVHGDLESHDGACRHLAEHSGVQVLAVDYRLAPEHPFPAGVDDAVAAYRWLVEHPERVNADPARLAVGGDSAGGNLSALVALAAARDNLPLAFQLLVYPATDFTATTASRRLFADGFFLTAEAIEHYTAWYLPDEAARKDPRASVLFADVPPGTAPALVVTAGFDPLRDEGEAYAARLADEGVPVETLRCAGLIHGFFNMVSVGRAAPEHNREIADRLRTALACGNGGRRTPSSTDLSTGRD